MKLHLLKNDRPFFIDIIACLFVLLALCLIQKIKRKSKKINIAYYFRNSYYFNHIKPLFMHLLFHTKQSYKRKTEPKNNLLHHKYNTN